ncbi:uncharacterized protein K460DRAFT_380436 [Cucurbitaria berberidis CBS 394.84]|uniref:Uncharacterized protein n=1 Tax=Cucurbitaria berberidis CBS 394.84 TaxID=1168544 RepID=A0A9P4L5G3_9PLEO|nr:uncharacterized protein K460DRAFT_380436 [Cucurbitaria berberidis CBS 394.84]KAF1842615.1 hypothetical protein K460DRAFT_380436 [Cucurbitaria berberidis CBS 394.84]
MGSQADPFFEHAIRYSSGSFCSLVYLAAFGNRQLAQKELKKEACSWRSGGYVDNSHLQVLNHDNGIGKIRMCNDDDIDQILLYEYGAVDPANPETPAPWVASTFNISQRALFKIMTNYDIAPAASSHIRGQEQTFGSKVSVNESGEVQAFEFWYAIRARAYFREVDKDADLKMNIVTKYDVPIKSTIVVLKYRSFNDLACKLKGGLISKLHELVMEPSTREVAKSPFAVSLLHFNATAQWYRRAARDPGDSLRKEEEKIHDGPENNENEVNAIIVRRLHLTMRNLDQDKLQLTFILGVIDSLRKQHDLFYRLVRKSPNPDDRDWLFLSVNGELDRIGNQLTYTGSSIEGVCHGTQRLLDLLFNISGLQNARWSEKVEKQTVYEGASMSAMALFFIFFLPGAFTCGTCSALRAASQEWILLITIIPIVDLPFFAWSITRKIEKDNIETTTLQGMAGGR